MALALYARVNGGQWGLVSRTPIELDQQPHAQQIHFQRQKDNWYKHRPEWEFIVTDESNMRGGEYRG